MNRIKEKIELINKYDKNLIYNNLKYLTKDIIETHRQELKEWTNIMTHQKNIEHYSTLVSLEEI